MWLDPVERMSNMVLRGAENLRTAPRDRKSVDRYEHVVVSEEAGERGSKEGGIVANA